MKNIPHQPGIYSITHVASKRRYVGQTTDLRERKWVHFSALRNNRHINPHLQNAWNKYGEQAFSFDVLEICLNEPVILAAREQFWIDKHIKKLFNIRKFAEQFCAEWHKTNEAKEVHQKASKRMKAYRDNLRRNFTCEQCREPFITNSPASNIRFCSAKCRGRWRWENDKYKERRTCPVCNAEFMATTYGNQKCCSKQCVTVEKTGITYKDVPVILARVLDGGNIMGIAKDYGVSRKVIRHMARRETFTNVSLPPEMEEEVIKRRDANMKQYESALTDNQVRDIKIRLANGENMSDISKAYGIPKGRVSAILRETNYKSVSMPKDIEEKLDLRRATRTLKLSIEAIKDIKRRLCHGQTHASIASIHNVSTATVTMINNNKLKFASTIQIDDPPSLFPTEPSPDTA